MQAGTFQRVAYHSPMRFLLFALMIALLPLRGWIGDAMATEMAMAALQQQVATKIIASQGHMMPSGDHFDHEAETPEAARGAQPPHSMNIMGAAESGRDCATDASDGSAHAANTHCESCSACQACHTVGLSPTATSLNPVFNSPALPHSLAAQFASAEAALGQKPPIS